MANEGEANTETAAPTTLEQQTIDHASEYIKDFITKRFPSGLDGDIRQIISECILDSFYDGARWSEQTRQEEAVEESQIILT
jgi:hypothetical protein